MISARPSATGGHHARPPTTARTSCVTPRQERARKYTWPSSVESESEFSDMDVSFADLEDEEEYRYNMMSCRQPTLMLPSRRVGLAEDIREERIERERNRKRRRL